jgi:hypothetical protein
LQDLPRQITAGTPMASIVSTCVLRAANSTSPRAGLLIAPCLISVNFTEGRHFFACFVFAYACRSLTRLGVPVEKRRRNRPAVARMSDVHSFVPTNSWRSRGDSTCGRHHGVFGSTRFEPCRLGGFRDDGLRAAPSSLVRTTSKKRCGRRVPPPHTIADQAGATAGPPKAVRV